MNLLKAVVLSSEFKKLPHFKKLFGKLQCGYLSVALTADIHVELLDLTPASGDVESDKCSENGDANDDDLTGGNLGMLNDSISELTRKRREENSDEVAYDIRPNKIQPLNEMVG